MKIATWNVNSLKVRLPQVLDWLETHRPDVLCLQETKLEDAAFPAAQIRAAGYHPLFSGQKTYNGVALLSTERAEMLATAIPGFRDEQKRVLASDVGGVRVVCVYVPNGEAVSSDKYRYKLDWLAAFTRWMKREVEHCPGLVLAGDVNIAPEPRDVHDPALWEGRVLHSEPERRAFRAGEIAVIPGGTWHWHGATKTSATCHISIKAVGATDWEVPRKNWEDY
ncbi:MAG: endonuclease/exonuclease/phosphatase family protein [Armatimonadetes bacterium]|nr:endonuclease/exonuclease/phosphatase family protein [Armatimonadota bacterium]